MSRIGLNRAVHEADNSAGALCHRLLVRDHDDGLAGRVQPVQQVENFFGRDRVQVPGRFIGQDKVRVVGQASSDGGTLLLTAGELKRSVLQAIAQSHLFGQLAAPLAVLGRHVPTIVKRCLDVLRNVQLRNKIIRLKDEAHVRGAYRRQTIVVQLADVLVA